MYKMQLLCCIALTLALMANGAPTSSSTKNTKKQLEPLLLDLQLLLKEVKVSLFPFLLKLLHLIFLTGAFFKITSVMLSQNYENADLSRMLTFKFYMPKQVSTTFYVQFTF